MAAPYFFESKAFGAMIVSSCQAHLGNGLPISFDSVFNIEIIPFTS